MKLLYTFCHSREGGNLEKYGMDSRLRGNDNRKKNYLSNSSNKVFSSPGLAEPRDSFIPCPMRN